MSTYRKIKVHGLAGIISSYASSLSGANSAFFVVHILIICLPEEMANMVDGHLSHPSRSSGEKVADDFQISGSISPGFRNLHLEKTCYCNKEGCERQDHELLIAKFRLKLNKVGKTSRPFKYDLNKIPYDYTGEVTNRFKGLHLIEFLKNYGWRFITLYRRR